MPKEASIPDKKNLKNSKKRFSFFKSWAFTGSKKKKCIDINKTQASKIETEKTEPLNDLDLKEPNAERKIYEQARNRHRCSNSITIVPLSTSNRTQKSTTVSPTFEDSLTVIDCSNENKHKRRTSSFTNNNSRWGYHATRSAQQLDVHESSRIGRLSEAKNNSFVHSNAYELSGSKSRNSRFMSDVVHSSFGNDVPSIIKNDFLKKMVYQSNPSSPQDSTDSSEWHLRYNYALKNGDLSHRRSLNSMKLVNRYNSNLRNSMMSNTRSLTDEDFHKNRSTSTNRSRQSSKNTNCFSPGGKIFSNELISCTEVDEQSDEKIMLSFTYAPQYCPNTSKYEFLGECAPDDTSFKKGYFHNDVGSIGGGFSRLYEARDKEIDTYYMVKVFDISLLEEADYETQKKVVESLKLEREILEGMINPFLIKSLSCMQDESSFYLIFDFTYGESLGSCLRREGRFSESATLFFVAEVVEALCYLHFKGIVYRAVSPESILLDEIGHVKLTDFSASKSNIWNEDSGCRTICGVDPYSAPEVQFGLVEHGLACDWWSVGILVYKLLTGNIPVPSVMIPGLDSEIESSIASMGCHACKGTKDFVKDLLKSDPCQRVDSDEKGEKNLKKHRYFDQIDWTVLQNLGYMSPLYVTQTQINSETTDNMATVRELVNAYNYHCQPVL